MSQFLFGDPTFLKTQESLFNLVWTYNINTEDGRKKAHYCTCGVSTLAGKAHVLDHTYANFVDHTSSRMFYSIHAMENHFIVGADVSNAFGKAPPPKQGFYMFPYRSFCEWWEKHLNHPPLWHNDVIPV
jgi:hypothetical protein